MTTVIIILMVINIPIYKLIFRMIFVDGEDFREAVKYEFTPDLFSLFKGRYRKDKLGEFKLGMFIMLCILVVGLEYGIINYIYNLF
ncbi:hypothetical protein [Clostridium sp.]|uniref:hypothetical protein n=1 Tax=Clostridium sp. TaxID=1506 RepID=UPI002FCBD508